MGQEGREDLAGTERDEVKVGGEETPGGEKELSQPLLQSDWAWLPLPGQLTFQN